MGDWKYLVIGIQNTEMHNAITIDFLQNENIV